jgi:16S rRNA (adenine1518-N6/adenine1519-N6)-dimethyltransferase
MERAEKSLESVKRLLGQYGLHAKKSLGQHFLINESVLKCVVSAAELTRQDTVIEVGPGLGVLTKEIAGQVRRVIAVEADSKLAFALGKIVGALPNVRVVNSDILETNPAFLLASGEIGASASNYKVVANIPYYITSPILRYFLEASHKPSLMVVMVQKEVGEAIIAQPGKMGILAVSVQLYGNPTIFDYVSAQSFYPPPKVDSAILQIKLYERPQVYVPEIDKFFEVVRAGFSAPRKQLRNSLAQGLSISPQEAVDLIEGAEIDPRRRAETLNLEEWARLCGVVSDHENAIKT